MKKRLWVMVLIIVLLSPLLSVTALADTGPKPSIVVSFKGLEQESYSVTLLSDKDSTDPWSKGKEYTESYGDETIWEKFNTFKDEDGFYFLGCFEDCSDTDTFKWTYYPPSIFKILIHFPEYDRYIVSADTYERYAFDSYYTVDATNLDIQSVSVAGLGVAWLFGFRTKKQIQVIGPMLRLRPF